MFKKGQSGNAAGRRPGAVDKKKADIKTSFQLLVEGNLPKIENWIDEIAARDPARALELIIKITEYILPKMKTSDLMPIEERQDRIIVVQSQQAADDINSLFE